MRATSFALTIAAVAGLNLAAALPAFAESKAGVELFVNGTQFPYNSEMKVEVRFFNTSSVPYTVYAYIAVEVAGSFYFHPHYTDYAWEIAGTYLPGGRLSAPADSGRRLVVQFRLAERISVDIPVTWYAAVLNTADLSLIGELVSAPVVLNAFQQPSYHAGDVVTTHPVLGELRYAPAGTFMQGSAAQVPCRDEDERQFSHELTRPFVVMTTEVTRQMWTSLRQGGMSLPSDPSNVTFSPQPANPVQSLTWNEAALFANLLSTAPLEPAYYIDAAFTTPVNSSNYLNVQRVHWKRSANGFRLPSEGEWEYVARAGTTDPFPVTSAAYSELTCWGASCAGSLPELDSAMVFCQNSSGETAAAGSKSANAWGLRDLHGNVREWCWDFYGSYPNTGLDFAGELGGTFRIVRGGSYQDMAAYCHSAFRLGMQPDGRDTTVGFRLVRNLD